MTAVDEVLNSLGDYAKTILVDDQDPELIPVYLLVADKLHILACPWRDEEEKLLTVELVRVKSRELNATMAGFLCEMWMTKHGPGVEPDDVKPPSQSPNRIEGVIAVATDGTETKARFWRTIRDRPAGKVLRLEEDQPLPGDGGVFTGRMIKDLIPPRTRH